MLPVTRTEGGFIHGMARRCRGDELSRIYIPHVVLSKESVDSIYIVQTIRLCCVVDLSAHSHQLHHLGRSPERCVVHVPEHALRIAGVGCTDCPLVLTKHQQRR